MGYDRVGPYEYLHLNAAGTTVVKVGPGTLHSVVVGTGFAAGTVACYDVATAGGIAAGNLITLLAAGVGASSPTLDCHFAAGLVVVVVNTPDVTVVYT